jgi:hypothetical protein
VISEGCFQSFNSWPVGSEMLRAVGQNALPSGLAQTAPPFQRETFAASTQCILEPPGVLLAPGPSVRPLVTSHWWVQLGVTEAARWSALRQSLSRHRVKLSPWLPQPWVCGRQHGFLRCHGSRQ